MLTQLPRDWPLRVVQSLPCHAATDLTVCHKRDVAIVSGTDRTLHVYRLSDGCLLRSSCLDDDAAFNWLSGGLCLTPKDSILVAEFFNNRLQEVSLDTLDHVRFVADGQLQQPDFVDCNDDVIVVSEFERDVVVLSAWDGAVIARTRDDAMGSPMGLRLSCDGSRVVVADLLGDRLCVFAVDDGRLLEEHCAELTRPVGVVEHEHGNGFVVVDASPTRCKLVRVYTDDEGLRSRAVGGSVVGGGAGAGASVGGDDDSASGSGSGASDGSDTLLRMPVAVAWTSGVRGRRGIVVLDSHGSSSHLVVVTEE